MNINISDYKIEINKVIEEEGGGYMASMPTLGCMADGDTIEEAIKELKEVANDLIEFALEKGTKIPDPKKYKIEDDYSGKLTLRLPRSLHKQLSERADEENCSINQLINNYISMGIGYNFGNKSISINFNGDLSDKKFNDIAWSHAGELNKYKVRDFISRENCMNNTIF